jgi:hypothetical protein
MAATTTGTESIFGPAAVRLLMKELTPTAADPPKIRASAATSNDCGLTEDLHGDSCLWDRPETKARLERAESKGSAS